MFGSHGLVLHHLKSKALKEFSKQLADAILELGSHAKNEGDAVACVKGSRLKLAKGRGWILRDVPPPPGIDAVVFSRNATNPVKVTYGEVHRGLFG